VFVSSLDEQHAARVAAPFPDGLDAAGHDPGVHGAFEGGERDGAAAGEHVGECGLDERRERGVASGGAPHDGLDAVDVACVVEEAGDGRFCPDDDERVFVVAQGGSEVIVEVSEASGASGVVDVGAVSASPVAGAGALDADGFEIERLGTQDRAASAVESWGVEGEGEQPVPGAAQLVVEEVSGGERVVDDDALAHGDCDTDAFGAIGVDEQGEAAGSWWHLGVLDGGAEPSDEVGVEP